MVDRQDMGDAQYGRSAESSGDVVRDDIHRETTGNRSTVGSVEATI